MTLELVALSVGYTILALGTAWMVLATVVFLVDRIAGHVKFIRLLTRAVYRRPKEVPAVEVRSEVAVTKLYPDAVDE